MICPFCSQQQYGEYKRSARYVFYGCGNCGMKRKEKNEVALPVKGVEYITVDTPQGQKNHGYIKNGIFCRKVRNKDLMRIFDAWSINPEALKKINELGIKQAIYGNTETGAEYQISVEEMNQFGFRRDSFAGGSTIYIPLKHWKIIK